MNLNWLTLSLFIFRIYNKTSDAFNINITFKLCKIPIIISAAQCHIRIQIYRRICVHVVGTKPRQICFSLYYDVIRIRLLNTSYYEAKWCKTKNHITISKTISKMGLKSKNESKREIHLSVSIVNWRIHW